MAVRAGRHRVGRDDGTLQVRTYREGIAQKVGHDLNIDVGQWEAAAEVREDGTLSAVQLDADSRSLEVREGLHGVKPLTDKDRADIRKTINEKVLGGRPILFRSTAIDPGNGVLTFRGELELAGRRRQASFELTAVADGRVRGALPVTQSEWGIKPYRGMMGALKVRDTVEVLSTCRYRLTNPRGSLPLRGPAVATGRCYEGAAGTGSSCRASQALSSAPVDARPRAPGKTPGRR